MSDFLDRVALEHDAADLVPPDEVLLAQRDALLDALYWLLSDFPELRRAYATHVAQRSLRTALALLAEHGRGLP